MNNPPARPESITIQAPSRLHFGLFGWGPAAPMQFGGLGLMIQNPQLELTVQLNENDQFHLPADQLDDFKKTLENCRYSLSQKKLPTPSLQFHLKSFPPRHSGLGSGTQRAMALATAIAFFSGYKTNSVHELAALANRFPRSGVGIHGFFHGGLIVDKGHPADLSGHLQIAAIDSRKYWPSQWEIILLIPAEPVGVSGFAEKKAFSDLPAPPANHMAHVRDVVFNGLLPAIESSDFASAMTALESLQRTVGGWFAPAQGGSIYGSPLRDQLVKQMRQVGLRGVGQSSWGPTLFGFAQSTLIDSIETNLRQSMGELTQNVQIIRTGPQNQGVFEINRL